MTLQKLLEANLIKALETKASMLKTMAIIKGKKKIWKANGIAENIDKALKEEYVKVQKEYLEGETKEVLGLDEAGLFEGARLLESYITKLKGTYRQ